MGKDKVTFDSCVKYINEKYGEEFTYLEPINEDQAILSSKRIYVENKNYPGEKILVVGENPGGYADNFLYVKYKQDTITLLESFAGEVYDDFRVLYQVGGSRVQPRDYTADMTFDEFITDKRTDIHFSVLVPPTHTDENGQEEMNKLFQLLADNKIVCMCDIFYMTDEDAYNTMTNYFHVESSLYSSRFMFDVNVNYEIKTYDEVIK